MASGIRRPCRTESPMTRPNDIPEPFRSALLDAVPCALFAMDREGHVIYWSASAERLTGYAAGEMLGSNCEALRLRLSGSSTAGPPDDLCPFGGQGEVDECELRHKDGHLVPIVRRASEVRQDGRNVGVVQAMIDVTPFKRARREIEALQREVARAGRFGELVGRSGEMLKLFEAIDLICQTDASVVIEGETGTGKELVARTIHARGPRRDGPFLPVNCGALPEPLLEAEMFGHVRGAFTGATADRAGRFEEADGGTLFLDEIGELPMPAQVKLLRAVQEGEVTRVGESVARRVDVRILAATHRGLPERIRSGHFRQDLYYRLRVVGMRVPPLRERMEDLPTLVAHFIERLNSRYGRRVEGCGPEAMDRLCAYDWPGNVRELEHALEHAFVVTPRETTTLPASALPPELLDAESEPARRRTTSAGERRHESTAGHGAVDHPDEAESVRRALEAADGNKAKAARMLGITRAGLYKKIKRLNLAL